MKTNEESSRGASKPPPYAYIAFCRRNWQGGLIFRRKSKNKIYDIQKADKMTNKDKELENMRKTSKYRSVNGLGEYGRRLFTEGMKECYKQVAAAQGVIIPEKRQYGSRHKENSIL